MRHRYRPHLVRKAQKTRDLDSHHTEQQHPSQIESVSGNTLPMTEERPTLKDATNRVKNAPKQFSMDLIWNSRFTGFDFTWKKLKHLRYQ